MESKEYWEDFAKEKDIYISYNDGDSNFKILNALKHNKKVLSLGCGAGREARLLAEHGDKVVAVDISPTMINKSKAFEPRAEYICEDAITYAERNKDKLKFDYIVGIYNFLAYIPLEHRRRLIDNLINMLNDDGQIIFTVPRIDRWQDLVKSLICFFMKGRKEWGDILNHKEYWAHHFTESQLKRLLKGYNYLIKGKEVYIFKIFKNESTIDMSAN